MICGLARTGKQDIDAAWNAVKDSERPRIHTFIATSDIHIERKLQTTREDVKGQARAAVAHARAVHRRRGVLARGRLALRRGVHGRGDPDRARRGRHHDQRAGHRGLHDARTSTRRCSRRLYELVPGLRDVTVVRALPRRPGAGRGQLARRARRRAPPGGVRHQRDRRARGQRVARGDRDAAAHARVDAWACGPASNTREIARTSRLVSRLTGYPVQPNKAIVGRNAFAHEAGIHQDGVLKERTTYEIMDATTIGLDANSIVLGKHSGRHALRNALEELGFQVEGAGAQHRLQALQGAGGQEEEGHRARPRGDRLRRDEAGARRRSSSSRSRSRRRNARAPLAKVRVRHARTASVRAGSFTGDGPVDAFFSALNAAVGHDARLKEYHVSAVTGGRDALGEVTVLLELDGRAGLGRGRVHRHPRGVGQGLPARALERARRTRRRPRPSTTSRRGAQAPTPTP